MKKLLLPLLLLLTISFASAQSFNVDRTTVTHNIYANSLTLNDTMNITNNTSADLVLVWERVVVSEPGGWTSWVCDDVICHPPSKDTDEWTIAANGHSEFSFHLNPGTVVGPGEYHIIFANKNNPSEVDTVKFLIDAAVGIDEFIVDPLLVYPNPANQSLFLDWEDQNYTHLDVEIMNTSGQMLKTAEINSQGHFGMIPVQDLAPGIYFARIYTGDEVLVRKFIKN